MTNRIFFLAVSLLLAGMGLKAQTAFTEQGNFLIGSTVGFSSNESRLKSSTQSGSAEGEGPYSLQWNLNPHIGYFLLDNFNLGIGLDYTFSREKQPNADKTDDSDLLFGPFARLYLPLGDDQAFFPRRQLRVRQLVGQPDYRRRAAKHQQQHHCRGRRTGIHDLFQPGRGA